jgi:FecR-like protein
MAYEDNQPGGPPMDDVERLLRVGGLRKTPDPSSREAARAAVRDAWRASARARTRRRWMLVGIPALAAAAVLAIAVALRPAPVPSQGAATVVARVAASTSVIQLRQGSARRAIAAGDVIHAGAIVDTPPGIVATFALEGGGELRQGGGTSVHWAAPRQVALDRGRVYVDSGGRPGASVAVETFAGVVRDIGTRFEVQITGDEIRVRVRNGTVRLESSSGHHEASAGHELVAPGGGTVEDRPVRTFGPEWDWILQATPFRLERSTLAQFLAWVEVEGGRQVQFRPSRLRDEVAATVLYGSIQGLSMDAALEAALPAAGLTFRLEGSRVIVERAAGGARR